MPLDAFLELRDERDKPAVDGECRDKVFGAAHRKAMSLNEFSLDSKVDLIPREATKKPVSTGTKTNTTQIGQSSFDNDLDDLMDDLDDTDDDQEFFTFTIKKDVDNASPQLYQAYCKNWTASTSHDPNQVKDDGKFASAKVTIRKSGGGSPIEYLVFEFREVWVKSWELKSDAENLPDEEIEFGFNAMQIRYYPQQSTGARGQEMPTGFWDFRSDSGEE